MIRLRHNYVSSLWQILGLICLLLSLFGYKMQVRQKSRSVATQPWIIQDPNPVILLKLRRSSLKNQPWISQDPTNGNPDRNKNGMQKLCQECGERYKTPKLLKAHRSISAFNALKMGSTPQKEMVINQKRKTSISSPLSSPRSDHPSSPRKWIFKKSLLMLHNL